MGGYPGGLYPVIHLREATLVVNPVYTPQGGYPGGKPPYIYLLAMRRIEASQTLNSLSGPSHSLLFSSFPSLIPAYSSLFLPFVQNRQPCASSGPETALPVSLLASSPMPVTSPLFITFSQECCADRGYTLGLRRGVKGVFLVFLHRFDLFSDPFVTNPP